MAVLFTEHSMDVFADRLIVARGRLIADGPRPTCARTPGAGGVLRHWQDICGARRTRRAGGMTTLPDAAGAKHRVPGMARRKSRLMWRCRCAEVRWWLLAQRRGQVHHAQGADGHGSAQRRRGVPGAGPSEPRGPPRGTPGSFVPEDRRVFTDLTVMENRSRPARPASLA
jgi:hypothetical protein